MENGQNLANEIQEIDAAMSVANPKPLTPQQQLWIDYNALGGLVSDQTQDWFDKDGNRVTMRKMPITEFANMIGIARETLRVWRDTIPDFWGKVNARRQQLAPQARLQKMHEVWFLSALKLGAEGYRDRQLWLANFDPDFHMPTEKHQVEVSDNYTALLAAAIKSGAIIEGETTNAAAKIDAGASAPNQPAHPNPS